MSKITQKLCNFVSLKNLMVRFFEINNVGGGKFLMSMTKI